MSRKMNPKWAERDRKRALDSTRILKNLKKSAASTVEKSQ